MKLHKKKFGTRPIINSKSHPTENLSWFLDSVLKPIIVLTESYIQNTQNLLQKTNNVTFPSDCKIYSFSILKVFIHKPIAFKDIHCPLRCYIFIALI